MALGLALFGAPSFVHAVDIDFVRVDAAGNAPDNNGLGAVADAFRIGRVEVTNAQYVELLNAVAADDPNGLFDQLMTDSDRGGIVRLGTPGAWTYDLKPDFADKPVNAVSWLDAVRFCNWLENGQPSGPQDATTTELGSYDLSLRHDAIVRRPGVRFFLPSIDEWYAAAYHDPNDPGADAGGSADYWRYPTRSDAVPDRAEADASGDVVNPGANVANLAGGADWNGENGNVTTVGSAGATSPWGAHDLAGNVGEWTETLGTPIPPNPPAQPGPLPTRVAPGGDFSNGEVVASSNLADAIDVNMISEAANFGFRVASIDCAVPGDPQDLRLRHDGVDVSLEWADPGVALRWNVHREMQPDTVTWGPPWLADLPDGDPLRPGIQAVDSGAVDGVPLYFYLVTATDACGTSPLR